jgi:hypothetical protein
MIGHVMCIPVYAIDDRPSGCFQLANAKSKLCASARNKVIFALPSDPMRSGQRFRRATGCRFLAERARRLR